MLRLLVMVAVTPAVFAFMVGWWCGWKCRGEPVVVPVNPHKPPVIEHWPSSRDTSFSRN